MFNVCGTETPLITAKTFSSRPLIESCHFTFWTLGIESFTTFSFPILVTVLTVISLPYFFKVQFAFLFELRWAMVKHALFFNA